MLVLWGLMEYNDKVCGVQILVRELPEGKPAFPSAQGGMNRKVAGTSR